MSSQIGYYEQHVRQGYYSPSARPERQPSSYAPVGTVTMGTAEDPCPIGPNELRFSLRHVATGNFKEFYRAAVPQNDGEHTVTLVNTTWAGCGPEELDGEQIVARVQGGVITHWRFSDGEWDEYDSEGW